MAALSAGQVLSASLLNDKLKKCIARASRITSSTGTTSTTFIPVLRLDSIPIKAGRAYRITWKGAFDTVTTTDTLRGVIRFTVTGTAAVAASSILPGSGGEAVFVNAASTYGCTIATDYVPVSDGRLSVLLGIQHNIGVSSGIFQADGSTFRTDMYVDDMGDDPGNTGVSL